MFDGNNTADVIVIGGGVAGLSTAMQLARRGADVAVVERERIGNGSTGRAAGLLGQLRGTAASTRMLMDGVEIVRELERETESEIFVQTGSVRVAATEDRAQEIRDLVAMGKSIGFDIDHLSIDELATKLPAMRTEDLLECCYCPTDGHLQPAELVSAYLRAGREAGVRYFAECPVIGLSHSDGRVQGVRTQAGELSAPTIVNAGGPWSHLLGDMAECVVPSMALGHYYLTTRPDEQQPVDRLCPALRDRHHRIYARPESGGLIVGMYGEETEVFDMATLPSDFDMSAMKARPDNIHVATLIHAAQQRFPWINERTPMTITAGIMTFTPDGKPFCGKMPHMDGLFHCTGFCGHGIVQSPAIGVIMAELILDGRTDYDIAAIEADRYFDMPGFQERTEIESKCYAMHAGYYGRVEGGDVQEDRE